MAISKQPMKSESQMRDDRLRRTFGDQWYAGHQVMQDLKNLDRPDRPAWESMLGDDGLMKTPYQLGEGGLQTDYLGKMREQALRDPGEASQWRQLMGQRLDQQMAQRGDQLAQQQAGQQAQAMNRLAMTGGLRGGAGERMGQQAATQGLLAQQRLAREGMGQRLGLDIQDEQNRLKGLSQLQAAELGTAGFRRGTQQYNIDKALQDVLQKRAADMSAYKEQMGAWGAEKTAAATPSGGGGKK